MITFYVCKRTSADFSPALKISFPHRFILDIPTQEYKTGIAFEAPNTSNYEEYYLLGYNAV
jgi:hypothetical protein